MSLRAGFVAAAFRVVILIHGIEYGAVHARGKFDGVEDCIVVSAYQLDHAKIIAVRYDQLVDVRQKNGGVRLAESGDAVEGLAL